MKKVLCLFFLIFTNYSYGQKITNVTRYRNYSNEDRSIIHFKTKTSSFAYTFGRSELDSTKTLFIGSNQKIVCPKDSMFMLELYDEKYLFVSFYSIEYPFPAYGVEYRTKDRVLIVDLKDPTKKWAFLLHNMVKTKDIKLFNPKTGELTIHRKLLPQPGSSTRISTSKY